MQTSAVLKFTLETLPPLPHHISMSEKSANLEATGKPTPAAGCLIFFVIIGMIAFLAIFSWYQYGTYKKEIINISQTEPNKVHLVAASDTDQATALRAKFDAFSNAVEKGEKASLSLNAEEMNLAIAIFPKLAVFREKLFVRSISDKEIHTDISFEVRAGFDGIRYLNGTMSLQPVIAKGSIFPIVTDITPDSGNPVPPKFTREFPTFIFTEYRNDKALSEVFHKLSKIELSADNMTIVSDPKIIQPDELPEDVSDETNRAFWVFALLVFMFITTVAFLLWIRKRKRTASES